MNRLRKSLEFSKQTRVRLRRSRLSPGKLWMVPQERIFSLQNSNERPTKSPTFIEKSCGSIGPAFQISQSQYGQILWSSEEDLSQWDWLGEDHTRYFPEFTQESLNRSYCSKDSFWPSLIGASWGYSSWIIWERSLSDWYTKRSPWIKMRVGRVERFREILKFQFIKNYRDCRSEIIVCSWILIFKVKSSSLEFRETREKP